jgi:hypothetical protein
MKTKLGWIAAGLLGIAALVSHAQNSQPVGAENARFRLFVTNQNGGGPIFRIDTQTGQTVVYQEGVVPGTSPAYRYHFWRPVDERLIVRDEADELRQAVAASVR